MVGARPTANDIDITKDGVTMRLKDAKGKEKTVQAEALMVGIGREPVIEDIGLEELGIKKDEGGFIIADSMLRTNVEGIYRDRRRQWPADARPHRHAPRHHRGRAHLRAEPVPAGRAQLALLHLLPSRRSARSD